MAFALRATVTDRAHRLAQSTTSDPGAGLRDVAAPPLSPALRDLVSRHRVHFTVEPEWVVVPGGRRAIGYDVRLFAVHDRAARALPGDATSRALAASLEELSAAVLPECRAGARVEIEPFRPALYESRVVRGADEVRITVRLLHHVERYDAPADAAEERCVKELRARLRRLAIHEG